MSAEKLAPMQHGERSITADTALRLARFFGNSERFWLNLQTAQDVEVEKDRLGGGYTGEQAGEPVRVTGTLRFRRYGARRLRHLRLTPIVSLLEESPPGL